jgi:hypothetical protein
MKKLKLNLDKDTILEFLLQNVEKIVLGLVGVIFLSMVYSAISKSGRFDKAPDQLQAEATSAQRTIDATPADSGLAELPGKDRDYVADASRSRDPIRENWYGIVLWDTPLFEKRPLRDVPALFAVQDLRGAAGMGAFHAAGAADKPEAGATPAKAASDSTRGQRWIVLTGLVPLEKQEAAYAETLKQSVFFDPTKDYPNYLGYWVQRVEVGNSGDTANPDWDKATEFLSYKAVNEAETLYSLAKESDVVNSKYIIRKLAFPLAPLARGRWDKHVAHEPEIGLEKKDAQGNPSGGHGPAGGRDSREAPGGGGDRAPAGESAPFGEEPKPGAVVKTVAVPSNDTAEEQKDLGYRLFRFFDFKVEPGKQYLYRVRLALANPNSGVRAAVLKNAALADKKVLITKWSEPSPIIAVPRETHVLANTVKLPRANADPTGQITVVKWLERSGLEVFHEFAVTRGQVANFPDVSVREAGSPVNFFSDVTALDFRGGEHLGKKTSTLAAPGEVLLMDSDGSLIVRNECDDSALCRQLNEARRESAPPAETHAAPKASATPSTGGRGLDAVNPSASPKKPSPSPKKRSR